MVIHSCPLSLLPSCIRPEWYQGYFGDYIHSHEYTVHARDMYTVIMTPVDDKISLQIIVYIDHGQNNNIMLKANRLLWHCAIIVEVVLF